MAVDRAAGRTGASVVPLTPRVGLLGLPLPGTASRDAQQSAKVVAAERRKAVQKEKAAAQKLQQDAEKAAARLAKAAQSGNKKAPSPSVALPEAALVELATRLLGNLEPGLLQSVGNAVARAHRNPIDLEVLAVLVADKLFPAIVAELSARPITIPGVQEWLDTYLAPFSSATDDVLSSLKRQETLSGLNQCISDSLAQLAHSARESKKAAAADHAETQRLLRLVLDR